jgi:hypothetical protein
MRYFASRYFNALPIYGFSNDAEDGAVFLGNRTRFHSTHRAGSSPVKPSLIYRMNRRR